MRALFTFFLAMVLAGAALAAGPQKLSIKEEKKTYSIDISYPRFGHPAVDRTLEAWAKSNAAEFRDSAREATGEINSWSAEIEYEVVRNDASMIVVAFNYYSYTGGAHPNTVTETFNFLMPDGRRVEFGELFSQRGVQRVSDISIARLKQELGGPDGASDIDWIKRGAGPNARNFSSFQLLPKTLHITFDAYQVAAYVAGPQEVTIPLSAIKDVMRPNPRAPAASFDCLNARSEVERAICASNELATLDRHLGEAYADKLTWADDAAKLAALRQAQRAWLRQRDASCRGPAISACLTAMYQKRLKELEAP